MKLRNKKTGEIGRLHCDMNVSPAKYGVFEDADTIRGHYWEYHSLAELNKEWEDYEESEEFWYINECGDVLKYKYDGGCSCPILEAEEIGNRFETKEEAEKAVEKLKAWTRMKKCGFRFWNLDTVHLKIGYSFENYTKEDIPQLKKDLALIFGGEDEI